MVRANEPLAEVNGDVISAEEVEKALGAQLAKLHEQIYTLKRQKLEALIRERLFAQEAARRGVSVQILLDAEVTSKVSVVTEQEVEQFYQANKTRLGSGDEATVREQVRNGLQNQKLAAQRDAFVQLLRGRAAVIVHLQAPPIVRVEVSVDGAPARGPETAPVTIVEFSDFYCPFCKQAEPTLARVLARYGDKIRLVYRDFPNEQLHPGAIKAAEGGRCAHEQGKFWAYHDILFQRPPGKGPDDLKTYAQQAGLDLVAFESCLASERYAAAVRKDLAEAVSLSIAGTPGFFINGRSLTGAQPLEAFVRLIEEELSRAR
jgi:protein-disulfide isomerase